MGIGPEVGSMIGWGIGGVIGGAIGGFLTITFLLNERNLSTSNLKKLPKSLVRGIKHSFKHLLQSFRLLPVTIKNIYIVSSNRKKIPGIVLGWVVSGLLGWAIDTQSYYGTNISWLIGWLKSEELLLQL